MVDDEAVEHGPQVISESPLALVGSGQFAGQQFGPEFLKYLVSEMLIADFQVDVFADGIVVAADELLHGRLALRTRGVGTADSCPDRGYLSQSLFCHRRHPNFPRAWYTNRRSKFSIRCHPPE